jgi:hypothetical protein
MVRFFFHLSDGVTTFDDVGTELASLTAVRRELVRVARELLNLRSTDLLWVEPWKVWVTDEPGGRGQTVGAIDLIGSFNT